MSSWLRTRFWHASTHGARTRCANALGCGKVTTQITATATMESARGPGPIRRFSVRRPSKRSSAALTRGCHSPSGLSFASRSSTHLFCSISFHVLLSKCVLCPAEQSANGGGIHLQRRRQFFITEAVAPKDQQFGLPRLDPSEHQANVLLLLSGGPDVLRRRHSPSEPEHLLIT